MPTEINFPLTTPATMTRYVMWHEDAVYGDLDISSPVYTGFFAVNKVHLRSDVDAELFYEAGSGYTWYACVDKGRNFTVDMDFAVAQIAELQHWTTLPNFGTPANTLAKAKTFLLARKINSAGTMTEAFQFLRHTFPTSLEFTLQQSALITGRLTVVPRLISKPIFTANGGLTTPTLPALGSISLPIWRHIDAGTAAITIGGVAYPMESMTVRYTQGFDFDRAYGSELIDAGSLGTLTVNGTFTSHAFKDLVMEGTVETGSLQTAGVAAIAIMKAGSGKFTFTKFTVKNLDQMIEFGSNNSQEATFDYEAQTAVIST
jgi:hypothetical protein